jgi:hypothetical protein
MNYMPELRKDLKITEEQAKKMVQAREQAKTRRLEAFQAARQNYQETGDRTKVSTLLAGIESLWAAENAAIIAVLSPAQQKRLEQIALQLEGPLACARPEVQDARNISPGQSLQIQAIIDQIGQVREQVSETGREMRSRLLDPASGGDVDPAARKALVKSPQFAKQVDAVEARMKSLWIKAGGVEQEAVHRIGRVLIRRQKAEFNKMLGEPFEFAPKTSPATADAATN